VRQGNDPSDESGNIGTGRGDGSDPSHPVSAQPEVAELDKGRPVSPEQRRLVKEFRCAGFSVRHRLTDAEDASLSEQFDRFDELSSPEQVAELERPDSPWFAGYLWQYDGFGVTILGRISSRRVAAPPPRMGSPQQARIHARAPRARRRTRSRGSRDRPRPSDDDDPNPAWARDPAGARSDHRVAARSAA
jgi:hypothetical protein